MTRQKQHSGLTGLSVLCALAVAAFAAAAGGDEPTAAASIRADAAKTAVIGAQPDNANNADNTGIAGFTIADYHQWRDNIGDNIAAPTTGDATGAGASATIGDDASATIGAGALSAAAANIDGIDGTNNIRAHQPRADNSAGFTFDPMANLRGFAADAINSGSIADSRRRAQMALFASLEDALSRHSEEALLLNFTTLKRSRIDIQTELGGRKGQLGAALVGVINEQPASALGWQLRVYGGQESSKGFNAGLFYRRIENDMLLGANLFADYENHRHGTFVRYSIGGEFQHRFVSFGANYYVPTTGEKAIDEHEVAFSRKGYDFRARLVIPRTRYIRAAMDYYNYDGGRLIASQSGLRYGAEAYHFPVPGLRFGLFYDTDKEQVGSEFSYTKTFGEEQQRIPADTEVPPLDLFAPVSREHSQRIAVSPLGGIVITLARSPDFQPAFALNTQRYNLGTLSASGGDGGYVWSVESAFSQDFDLRTVSGGSQRIIEFGLLDNARVAAVGLGSVLVATVIVQDGNRLTERALITVLVGAPVITTRTTGQVTTTMTQLSLMTVDMRLASVHFTTFVPTWEVVSTEIPILVTLPPVGTPRPHAITVTQNWGARFRARMSGESHAIVVQHSNTAFLGQSYNFNNSDFVQAITIVEGSEQRLPPTITTMTIGTVTTTMLATTTITTTITALSPNAAMSKSPFDNGGGGKDGGMTNPPLAINRPIPTRPPAKSAAGYYLPPACVARGGCEFAKGKVAGGATPPATSPNPATQRPPPESAFALSPPPAKRRGVAQT